ncbi:MAG: glycosyltransferase, partial [Sphingopyxis terrae]
MARAQHIVIIFHDFSFGGTEVIALRLAREWVAQGRRVTLLCGTFDGPLRSAVPR